MPVIGALFPDELDLEPLMLPALDEDELAFLPPLPRPRFMT
eukprot:CAMPEP_0171564546 /NCGR_PEP_ID=MMETSP0960-20121227/16350_1 /TAXON_ID=87120 /ORGANISM="Aurantiochytrium limacinum, Strain ATCCMYA-1381" /LENGTH=40 /DNA_ID= /DNA_START= /DNA_END= /DNA_ORIENTATION=